VAANVIEERGGGSFLLELLQFAGWRLRVRGDGPARIWARRADVGLAVTGATLAEAAGIVFARAMRSKPSERPER
jgi:hypothetical protein